jgi:shikimate kinase
MQKTNIVLCGFMGSGKSRLGRLLASKLQLRFEDLDESIQKELQLSIPQIFENFGQDYFRSLERDSLERKLTDTHRVLSLGGGSLSSQKLVDQVKNHNLLVFIAPEFDDLIGRIQGKSKRPLVMNPDGTYKSKQTLVNDLFPLYESRLEFYNQSHIRFTPEPQWTPEQSGGNLLELIQKFHDAV